MKLLLTLATLLSLSTLLPAADSDKHTHEKIQAGPTGGRLITEVEPHVEFFVNTDKKVEIRFINDADKVVPPASQIITVTLGDRSAPTKLTFTKDGDKLISDKTIPAGNDYPTVVQIREKEGAKPLNEKFNLNLDQCPTCKNKEYACICAHDEEAKKEDKK
jgi:hypothetical protein